MRTSSTLCFWSHLLSTRAFFTAVLLLPLIQYFALQVDIWSLGVILYTMLVGKPPFETADIETTYKRIRANSYSFPPHIPLTENAKHLVQSILQTGELHRNKLYFKYEILNDWSISWYFSLGMELRHSPVYPLYRCRMCITVTPLPLSACSCLRTSSDTTRFL